MFISMFCRVKDFPRWILDMEPGQHPVPKEEMEPRQIRLIPEKLKGQKVLIWMSEHRGSMIQIIQRHIAISLIAEGKATWEEQKALVCSMDEYLVDEHVVPHPEEIERAKASGAKKVLVAFIGENRSPLAFTRNVRDGVTKENYKEEAAAAMRAADVILVED